jgi:hypothetical protein
MLERHHTVVPTGRTMPVEWMSWIALFLHARGRVDPAVAEAAKLSLASPFDSGGSRRERWGRDGNTE